MKISRAFRSGSVSRGSGLHFVSPHREASKAKREISYVSNEEITTVLGGHTSHRELLWNASNPP
jgi:hypothetical protein